MQLMTMTRCSVFLVLFGVSAPSMAETIAQPLPTAGMKMPQVQSQFGQPAEKLASMGKPPITVWRYADFNVYFEHQTVLHSVRFVPFVRPIEVVIESTGYPRP
ncbi:MAG: hypothetical protein ACEQSD_09510 [Flavobacteriales bacterium]